MECCTLPRDNGRSRNTPTGLSPFGHRLRGVFHRPPSPLSTSQGLSWQGKTAYFSASLLWDRIIAKGRSFVKP